MVIATEQSVSFETSRNYETRRYSKFNSEKEHVESKSLTPSHQFGFRDKHSTIDQVYRITNAIEKAYEEEKVCLGIFLDVAQTFDKV